MDGLNKSNCAYALDGTCPHSADKCAVCKIDRETSEIHKQIVIGGLTWDDIVRWQREKVDPDACRNGGDR